MRRPDHLVSTGEERQKEHMSGLSLHVGLNFFLVSLSICDTSSGPSLSFQTE